MKKIIIALALVFNLLNHSLLADTAPSPIFKWQVGEDLIYSVKWSFVYLGSLHLQVLGTDTVNGRQVYHCRIYIDSNPSLPFVNIHDMYDSYIDAEGFYSHIFISYEKKSDHVLYTRYDFNYENYRVKIRIEKHRDQEVEIVLDSTAVIPRKVQDSLSLLFFARAMVKTSVKIDVPVFAFNKLEITRINFTGKRKKIKANDHKIEGYYLDGKLKFVGIAGIKEGFKGWFSLDKQSVPLKAYMKAFIGNVRIELDQWEKWEGDTIFREINRQLENKNK